MGIFQERAESRDSHCVFDESPPFPKIIMMEPANSCNLRCVFCDNKSNDRKKTLLEFDLAEKILHDAYQAGSREVGFYLTGEPLLNPDLHRMVAVAKHMGYTYAYITTNGVTATEERVRELIENGLDSLKYSINAGDRDSYRRIHGVDAYDRVKANLHASIKMRESGILSRLLISSVYTDHPDESLLAFHREISPRVDDYLWHEAAVDDRLGFRQKEGFCVFPFKQAHVTAEGYLNICCQDHRNTLVVADLSKVSIDEAWSGENFRRFRKKFLQRDLVGTLCGRCLFGCIEPIVPLEF